MSPEDILLANLLGMKIKSVSERSTTEREQLLTPQKIQIAAQMSSLTNGTDGSISGERGGTGTHQRDKAAQEQQLLQILHKTPVSSSKMVMMTSPIQRPATPEVTNLNTTTPSSPSSLLLSLLGNPHTSAPPPPPPSMQNKSVCTSHKVNLGVSTKNGEAWLKSVLHVPQLPLEASQLPSENVIFRTSLSKKELNYSHSNPTMLDEFSITNQEKNNHSSSKVQPAAILKRPVEGSQHAVPSRPCNEPVCCVESNSPPQRPARQRNSRKNTMIVEQEKGTDSAQKLPQTSLESKHSESKRGSFYNKGNAMAQATGGKHLAKKTTGDLNEFVSSLRERPQNRKLQSKKYYNEEPEEERYAWSSFQLSPDPKHLPKPPSFDDDESASWKMAKREHNSQKCSPPAQTAPYRSISSIEETTLNHQGQERMERKEFINHTKQDHLVEVCVLGDLKDHTLLQNRISIEGDMKRSFQTPSPFQNLFLKGGNLSNHISAEQNLKKLLNISDS